MLDLLTWFVARYGPQGGDGQPWSFLGNDALSAGQLFSDSAFTIVLVSAYLAAEWVLPPGS